MEKRMAEERTTLVRAGRTPVFFRITDLMLDRILVRTRVLLWPFKMLTWLWNWLAAGVWLLSNEYTKHTFGYCGSGVRIYGRFHVTAPDKLDVGDNVHINTNAFLRAEGGLHIGDNTHISRNLVVYTMNHNYAGDRLPYDASKLLKPVKIGRNVWIGMNVVIAPGVTVGDGAIIGMGAVVAQDVPPLAIVGSVPYRILKMRDKTHYRELDESHQYGRMSGYV